MLEFRVIARVGVEVRARVTYSWGTKRLGTTRLRYEMSGSLCNIVAMFRAVNFLRIIYSAV